MCSILFTNQNLSEEEIFRLNRYIKPRGPDYTGVVRRDGMTFVHNLLSITGKYTPQPYVDDTNGIICIYNGEIYNHRDFGEFGTDGECIIPVYRKFGPDGMKKLDGEFAIIIADLNNDSLVCAVDAFKTKPLWIYNREGSISIASYASAIPQSNSKQYSPNTISVWNLKDPSKPIYETEQTRWDLNQHKSTYEGWMLAFERSIRKRTDSVREKLFLGLSSGYDSGAIVCELLKQKKLFTAYTAGRSENLQIMSLRETLLKNSGISLHVLSESLSDVDRRLAENVESYTYDISSSSSSYSEKILLHQDSGSKGLDIISNRAIFDGNKIYLSGSGADEIISDYGWNGHKYFSHSNFGGKFPEDLSSIFPWRSFYGSTMRSYLDKEEYVAGSHGIETRYPFLDRDLVQEFLWLDHRLKNAKYKSPIAEYFDMNKFPYAVEKRGFNPT